MASSSTTTAWTHRHMSSLCNVMPRAVDNTFNATWRNCHDAARSETTRLGLVAPTTSPEVLAHFTVSGDKYERPMPSTCLLIVLLGSACAKGQRAHNEIIDIPRKYSRDDLVDNLRRKCKVRLGLYHVYNLHRPQYRKLRVRARLSNDSKIQRELSA